MIWRPHPGQRVRLAYRRSLRQATLWLAAAPHGLTGTVETVGRGPKMINVLVRTERGLIVVPRGHLMAEDEQARERGRG